MSKKIFCKDCRYIHWIPVDGPQMSEARCKKIKGYDVRNTPIKQTKEPVYCKCMIDNRTNECPFFEDKQRILNRIFNWSW